jgi:hypothetical protein
MRSHGQTTALAHREPLSVQRPSSRLDGYQGTQQADAPSTELAALPPVTSLLFCPSPALPPIAVKFTVAEWQTCASPALYYKQVLSHQAQKGARSTRRAP